METLARGSRSLLLGWARQASPLEACGVIVEGQPIRVTNTSEDPNYFVMDQRELMDVFNTYGDVDGVWHSHPEGQEYPSDTDVRLHTPGKRMLIVTLDKVVEWEVVGGLAKRLGEI